MRVIVDGIVYSTAPSGGVFHYFNEIIPRIAKFPDTDVEILAPQSAVFLPKAKNVLVKREILPTGGWFPQGKIRMFLGRIKRLLENRLMKLRLGSHKNTVFHSTYYTLAPWTGIPQVLTVHDFIGEIFPEFTYLPHHIALRKKKEECIKKANRFIAVSQKTKNDLCRIYNVLPDKVDVIHHGIDYKFYSQPILEEQKKAFIKKHGLSLPYLLYVGGRLHHKNFLRALEAFSLSKSSDDHTFTVAGAAWSVDEIAMIQKLGLNTKVCLVISPNDQELCFLYQLSQGFIYPSLYEGFGMSILEAFAAGTPVAAAYAGSIPEVGGDAVLYFNPENTKEIVCAIDSVLNSQKSEQLRKKGLERVKVFSWDKAARLTMETYQKALSEF